MPTTFAQTIDGNYIYAQRAVQDKNGDDIDQTYAKLTDIPSGTQLVPTATSADADKVLTVDAQGTPGWASAQAPISAGNGINIANNVVSVDTSVVVTQTDLAGKEDAFDVGTGLEMDTSGSTPTLQVEAPVDIVAGPGIVIDNPDGNTLRVSQAYPTDETVLYQAATDEGTTLQLDQYVTLSESMTHFERVRIYYAVQKPWAGKGVFESYMVDGDLKVNLHDVWYREQSGFNVWYETFTYNKYTDSNLRFTQAGGVQRAILNTTWNTTSGLTTIVYKIVGVHRLVANN